jgi:hypothetical protein
MICFAFQMLYALARLTIDNLQEKNNLDQSGHFFDQICFFRPVARPSKGRI